MQPNELSGSTLAYIGDAVWSLLVREYLVELGYGRAKDLQRLSVKFVSAKAQARFYEQLHAAGALNEEEEEIFRRGRNFKSGSVPKNTDVQIYRISTGFEALTGWWHLTGQAQRLREVWEQVRETVVLDFNPAVTN